MNKIYLFLFICSFSYAQLADWESITNMNNVKDFTIINNVIWAASDGGLFSYDLNTEEIKRFTNIDGLRSVNLSVITQDSRNELIVGTKDGYLQNFNIQANRWKTIRFDGNEIKDLKSVGDTLWVASNDGIAVYLLRNDEYSFSDFFINFPELITAVNAIEVYDGRIWLGTDNGLLSAPSDFNRFTLTDPQSWKIFKSSDGLQDDNTLSLYSYAEKLWIGASKGLSYLQGVNSIITVSDFSNITVNKISSNNQNLLLASTTALYNFSTENGIQSTISYSHRITSIETDELNLSWLSLETRGIRNSNTNKSITLDGPILNNIRYIFKDSNERLWCSSGKFKLTPNQGYFLNENNIWTGYDFAGSGWSNLGNTDYIYEDRFGNVFLGSWGGGVIYQRNNSYKYIHNHGSAGSTLISSKDTTFTQSIEPIDNIYKGFLNPAGNSIDDYIVVTAFKEGPNGRLWIVNPYASNGQYIAVAPYNSSGDLEYNISQWVYFGRNDGITLNEGGLSSIEFDDFGRVWIGTNGDGVYILDYKNTLTSKADDQLFHLDINDNLYSDAITSLAKDSDGIVWIGTRGGLNSFDGLNIFRHVGDEKGLDGPINTTISQIVIDDYNNKWIATEGGLSILRAAKSPFEPGAWVSYTQDNSGLIDDLVHGIHLDPDKGEAFIATENGISLFRGSFAEIQDNFNNVIMGPNPFLLGENTTFTINKLRSNSTVKILTLRGTLVRELNVSNKQIDGSRASWDGKDSSGQKVASGIYLFMGYTEDGKSVTGKVAVINN